MKLSTSTPFPPSRLASRASSATAGGTADEWTSHGSAAPITNAALITGDDDKAGSGMGQDRMCGVCRNVRSRIGEHCVFKPPQDSNSAERRSGAEERRIWQCYPRGPHPWLVSWAPGGWRRVAKLDASGDWVVAGVLAAKSRRCYHNEEPRKEARCSVHNCGYAACHARAKPPQPRRADYPVSTCDIQLKVDTSYACWGFAKMPLVE